MIHKTAQTSISWNLSLDADLNYHLFDTYVGTLCYEIKNKRILS